MGARFHWIANTAVAIFFVLGLVLSGRHPWIFYLWLAALLTFAGALLFSYFIQSAWQRKTPRAGEAGPSQSSPERP